MLHLTLHNHDVIEFTPDPVLWKGILYLTPAESPILMDTYWNAPFPAMAKGRRVKYSFDNVEYGLCYRTVRLHGNNVLQVYGKKV